MSQHLRARAAAAAARFHPPLEDPSTSIAASELSHPVRRGPRLQPVAPTNAAVPPGLRPPETTSDVSPTRPFIIRRAVRTPLGLLASGPAIVDTLMHDQSREETPTVIVPNHMMIPHPTNHHHYHHDFLRRYYHHHHHQPHRRVETYYYPSNSNIIERVWVDQEEGTIILDGDIISNIDQHDHTNGGGGDVSEETIGRRLKMRKARRDEDTDKVCAVCLEGLICGRDDDEISDDRIGVLDNCGHEFHVGCIEKWLTKKNVCPLCRATALGR